MKKLPDLTSFLAISPIDCHIQHSFDRNRYIALHPTHSTDSYSAHKHKKIFCPKAVETTVVKQSISHGSRIILLFFSNSV